MYYKIYYPEGMRFFGEKAKKILGLEKYNPKKDQYQPVFFLGFYCQKDYIIFKDHQGKKAIFWNGSDVKILASSPYYQQVIKSFPQATHACHSVLLQEELRNMGISAKIRPIFFGLEKDFTSVVQTKNNSDRLFRSAPWEGKEYGVDLIEKIAHKLPDIKFYILRRRGGQTQKTFLSGDK